MIFKRCAGGFTNFLCKYGGYRKDMIYVADNEILAKKGILYQDRPKSDFLHLVYSRDKDILFQFCVIDGYYKDYKYLDIPRDLYNKSDDMFKYLCENYGGGWIWSNNIPNGKIWIPDLLEYEIINVA